MSALAHSVGVFWGKKATKRSRLNRFLFFALVIRILIKDFLQNILLMSSEILKQKKVYTREIMTLIFM